MSAEKVKAFLDSHQVKYLAIQHSPAYTAREIAQAAHIPGKEMAKTVMVKLDGKMAMAVLPATRELNFSLLQAASGAQKMELAGELAFQGLFPDCEIGAMPPFGNLYDMPVYMDEKLAEDAQIAFNAGSHAELLKMAYADYAALVKPLIVKLAS